MTSTTIFSGDFAEAKPSSRVLKPPGGGPSNIFNLDESPAKPASKPQPPAEQPASRPPPVNNISTGPAPSSTMGSTSSSNMPTERPGQKTDVAAGIASPDPVTQHRKTRAGAFNPITGEAYNDQPVQSEKPATSIQVKQPPGGASTKLW